MEMLESPVPQPDGDKQLRPFRALKSKNARTSFFGEHVGQPVLDVPAMDIGACGAGSRLRATGWNRQASLCKQAP